MSRAIDRSAYGLLAFAIFVVASLSPDFAKGNAQSRPLTDSAGNAQRGREIVLDRERGHCVLCHKISQLDAPFQGNIGPELTGVGNRLNASELRRRIVDPTALNADSVMPAYYRTEGLTQVAPEFRGRSILTAQEVEDVVVYLQTLKGVADAN